MILTFVAVFVAFPICLIGWIVYAYKTDGFWPSIGYGSIFGGCAAIVVGLVVAACYGIYTAISPLPNITKCDSWITPVNLTDGQSVSGRFYLFGGTIQDDPVYFYYYRTHSGSYKRSYVLADDSEIIETDDPPRILICRTHRPGDWLRFGSGTDETYKISVPKGSISNNFNLGPSSN